jgi:hypothetical protein
VGGYYGIVLYFSWILLDIDLQLSVNLTYSSDLATVSNRIIMRVYSTIVRALLLSSVLTNVLHVFGEWVGVELG